MASLPILVALGIAVAVWHDRAQGPVALLTLGLSGLMVCDLQLVLLQARRANRMAAQVALYDLEWDRRRAAAVDELRDDMGRLHADLARLSALVETTRTPQATRGDGGRRDVETERSEEHVGPPSSGGGRGRT
ncbi:hypothetical protein ACFSBG_15600 [Georgenia yuyongxinii]|uniref:hypothetical protein n=1 Tax=Georgenia yuyongxinii TaxID=2589797 RepID=UPI00364496BA